MSNHIEWFDRRFDFSFPVGLFPELIERLRGTPDRLAARLGPLPAELLTRRPGADWSIQEHAGHLFDLEALVHLRLDDYARGAPVLHAADLTNRRTWEAGHNDRPLTAVLDDFQRERQRTVSRLEALPPAAFGQVSHHPRLEVPMRQVDLLLFFAEHDDYHLARIAGLLRGFGSA